MSFLQNTDVKTVNELISLGADKFSLIKDEDVWVTANGINKTLFNAIKDGDIGTGTGVETAYKQIAYRNELTSKKINSIIYGANKTSVELAFIFEEADMLSVYIDGKYYSEFISALITPNRYFKRVADNTIEIFGDVTEMDVTIELHPSIDLHPLLKTMYLSLNLKFEAYIQGAVFLNASSVTGNVIELTKEVSKDDTTILFIDGLLIPNSLYSVTQGRRLVIEAPFTNTSTITFHAFFSSAIKAPYVAKKLSLNDDNASVYDLFATDDGDIVLETSSYYANDVTFQYNGRLLRIGAQNGSPYIEDYASNIILPELFLESADGSLWRVLFANDQISLERATNARSVVFKEEGKVLYEIGENFIRLNPRDTDGDKKGLTNPFSFTNKGKLTGVSKELLRKISHEGVELDSDSFSKSEIHFDYDLRVDATTDFYYNPDYKGWDSAVFLGLSYICVTHHQIPTDGSNWIYQYYSRSYLNITAFSSTSISLYPYWYQWWRPNIEQGFQGSSGVLEWNYFASYIKNSNKTKRYK